MLVLQPAGARPTAGNGISGNTSTDDGRRSGAGLELAGPAAGSGVQDTDLFSNHVTTSAVGGVPTAALRVADPVDTASVQDIVLTVSGGAALVDVGTGRTR